VASAFAALSIADFLQFAYAAAERPSPPDTKQLCSVGSDRLLVTGEDSARPAVAAEARQGRLTARPPHRPRSDFTVGLERLKVDGGTGGLLYVPAGVPPERPAPFILLFHGAGATAQDGLNLLVDQADDVGPVLLAPNSQGRTWDLLLGGYGPDVARVDQALAETLQRLPVDPTRLAIGGFSDGAPYAVSLGLTNGNLFSHVLAFSPGFAAPARRRGRPHVFVSHCAGRSGLAAVADSLRGIAIRARWESTVTHPLRWMGRTRTRWRIRMPPASPGAG
jgi:phospholipase/carboxylesterase